MGYFKKKIKSEPVNPLFDKIAKELFAAVSLIVNERTWCQKALARDTEGVRLFDPSDASAAAWDILGALHKVDAGKETFTYLRIAAKLSGYRDLDRFNDFNTHKNVMSFFKAGLKEMGYNFRRLSSDGQEIL